MAHPKKRISKSRKNKRRTHYKAENPTLSNCVTTGETHLRHRAYEVDGNIYYKGKILISAEDIVDEEIETSDD